MSAYTLFGVEFEFEDSLLGSSWVNKKEQSSNLYYLQQVQGDVIRFKNAVTGESLALLRSMAEKQMCPT